LQQDDQLQAKRTWNDSKNRKEKLDRGQFNDKEV
jgi:Myb-like DNA-binding domain